MTYALDTCIISFLIKNDEMVKELYELTITSGNHCVLPLMVYFEVKRGLLSKDAQSRISMFNELCETISVEELTCDDMDVAATLFATHRHGSTINNSELIIAAQCITRGHTLVTHNVHHFEGIDRLQIVDWAGYKYIPFF